MTRRGSREDALRRYLLGAVTEEEQQGAERELLAGDVAFEEVLAAEDELRYEYVQDALAPEERRRFEERFLRTGDGPRRLARARALLAALGRGRAVRRVRSARRWALAATLTLAVAATVLLARWPSRAAPVAAGASAPSVVTLATPPASARVEPAPVVVALSLAPGVARGGGGDHRAALSRDAVLLRLHLALPHAAPAGPYRAVVRSADGREVWRGDTLTGDRERPGRLTVDVPAWSLEEGDYELTLSVRRSSGARKLADYAFGVLRPRPD